MTDLGCPIPGLSWNLNTKWISGVIRARRIGPLGSLHLGSSSIRAAKPKSRGDLAIRGEDKRSASIEFGTLGLIRCGSRGFINHVIPVRRNAYSLSESVGPRNGIIGDLPT